MAHALPHLSEEEFSSECLKPFNFNQDRFTTTQLLQAQAHRQGHEEGEREGYVAGWGWGFTNGLVIGTAAMAMAFLLGLSWGAR